MGILPSLAQAEETSGINLNPLTIHPLLKIKYGFDSNVFHASSEFPANSEYPRSATSSGYLDLVSELGLELQFSNWLFLNNFRVHFIDYQNSHASQQSTTGYPEFSGDHMLKWKSPAQGLDLEAEEKWKVTSDPMLQDYLAWQWQRVKRLNNELGGTFAYTSRSGFWLEKLKYSWERDQYLQSLFRQANYGVHTLTLQGENHLLPETSLALALRYRNVYWDQKEYGQERNSDDLNLSTSFNGRVSEKLSSILGLGYEADLYRNGDFEGTPVAVLKLIWKPRETMEFTFLGQREVRPSTTSQSYFNNVFQVSSRFQNLWPRGLEFGANFQWEWDQYQKIDARNEIIYHVHAETMYKFAGVLNWLKLGAEYNFDLAQNDSPFYPYHEHQVNFILEASY